MQTVDVGRDPRVVMVGFYWPEDGYCSGQFQVSATETATEVRVGDVISRNARGGICAGLGVSDHRAWVELRLAAPLGKRRVVRDSDGLPLTVVPL